MNESRRTRPTVRVIRDDLHDGWESPHPQRLIRDGKLTELHPLSELPHPRILKATEAIGDDSALDNYEGKIRASQNYSLLKIKAGQWRGAVWLDPDANVHWLIAAGLAKGSHEDHDDFYFRVEQAVTSGAVEAWLPKNEDKRLLKQETAGRLLTEWDLEIQRRVLQILENIRPGTPRTIEIPHPLNDAETYAVIELEISSFQEPGYTFDEAVVSIDFGSGRYNAKKQSKDDGSIGSSLQPGGHLEWQLTLRLLISLHPPEQDWERFQDEFSTYAETGYWQKRGQVLRDLVDRGELAESKPGVHKHYAHRAHIAGSLIEGTGIRAMCGVFFVARQDYASLPLCPECHDRFEKLPAL